jgi:hypothetical protein
VSHLLAGLFGKIAGVLFLEVLNRGLDALLLFDQGLAEPIRLDGA